MSSGDALLIFTAHDAELGIIGGGLAPAVLNTFQTSPSPVGPHDKISVLDCDDDDEYSMQWTAFLPNHYTGNGINVEILWFCAATSGNAEWSTWFKRLIDGDDLSGKTWFGGQSGISTAEAVANDVNSVVIAHNDGAQMGDVAANEFFRFSIRRNAPGPPDSVTGIIKFLAAYVTEQ